MAGVGTADVPAVSGTSYCSAVPSGDSSGIYMVLEMRVGNKGILKAVVNIIDIIAHKLLGLDISVETLDGTRNQWCWSRANFSANATLSCRCCEE